MDSTVNGIVQVNYISVLLDTFGINCGKVRSLGNGKGNMSRVTERKWLLVAPQLFTANGTSDGIVTIPSTEFFRVKQEIVIKSDTQQPTQNLEIKRILSKTQMIIGLKGDITLKSNLTSYLVADNATISAAEQARSAINTETHQRATYEEEPIMARRSVLVDKYGTIIDEDDPLPVAPVGGVVNQDWDDLLLTRDPVTQDITVATYKKNGITVRTVNLSYDANENLEEVTKS